MQWLGLWFLCFYRHHCHWMGPGVRQISVASHSSKFLYGRSKLLRVTNEFYILSLDLINIEISLQLFEFIICFLGCFDKWIGWSFIRFDRKKKYNSITLYHSCSVFVSHFNFPNISYVYWCEVLCWRMHSQCLGCLVCYCRRNSLWANANKYRSCI